MTNFGPQQHVCVENEWYDGPVAGIVDTNGHPHRFRRIFDEAEDEYSEAFFLWPVKNEELALEIEQWQIYVEFNTRYEAGIVGTELHPGHGNINKRWDEIHALLKPNRSQVPSNATKALANFEWIDRENRYEVSGPNYTLGWIFLYAALARSP